MHISSKIRSVVVTLLMAAPIAACTDLSTREQFSTPAIEQCTFTQGYWKNHPEAWPVTSLSLGGHVYTQTQLLLIFKTPVAGNGLISLAHQLIAAKLNVALGAPDADIADEIAAADALIGALLVPPIGSGYLHPSLTSALVGALDDFNSSQLTGDECVPDEPKCGDHHVDPGEQCDDGNTTNGDGCSATCQTEKVPCCGDHVIDPGEQCDDGNTTSGDGCSSTCQTEKAPCCGDHVIDPGEQCDDGNTTSGDGCSATCQTEVCVTVD